MRSFTLGSLFLLIASGCSGSEPPPAHDAGMAEAAAPGCDGACCRDACVDARAAALSDIGHLVIIYLENRSFDHLYGGYAGAEGLSSPKAAIAQIEEKTGLPYASLPHDFDDTT